MNGLCKNSVTPLRDQTYWIMGIEEREEVKAKGIGKIKNQIIKNKSWERDVHPGTGGFKDTK
jgi:hypothetical protein